jgi:hypothetical protein
MDNGTIGPTSVAFHFSELNINGSGSPRTRTLAQWFRFGFSHNFSQFVNPQKKSFLLENSIVLDFFFRKILL